MQKAQVAQIRRKCRFLSVEMDERGRRQWAAAEARESGGGGVTVVARATGLSRPTISAGPRELEMPAGRVRRLGGGRESLVETDPGLPAALKTRIEPATRGDPESPLRWTCQSTHRLADDLGLQLHVCRFPPGTGKWNKIEHRLFSFITQNWRGQPLVSHQAVVSLIASTTTKTGLIVKAALDTNRYETAVKVTDDPLRRIQLKPHTFHGKWNYMPTPRKRIGTCYF